MNGQIIGFRPQSKKLESPYKTLSDTLTMKGLRTSINFTEFERLVYGSTSTTHFKLTLEDVDTGNLEEEEILLCACPEDQEPD